MVLPVYERVGNVFCHDVMTSTSALVCSEVCMQVHTSVYVPLLSILLRTDQSVYSYAHYPLR
jgi:hypothetical protein